MLRALRDHLSLSSDDAREMLVRAFGRHPDRRQIAVRLWNGEEVSWDEEPDFTIVFGDAETFRRCFASGDPAELAEAFVGLVPAAEG